MIYVLTSEHGSMVVFLALAYFRSQELKVSCFHRHSGISMVSVVATTVGQTTVDKQQCVCFELNAGNSNAGGRKDSNLKLYD